MRDHRCVTKLILITFVNLSQLLGNQVIIWHSRSVRLKLPCVIVYRMWRRAPRTEPWGTPNLSCKNRSIRTIHTDILWSITEITSTPDQGCRQWCLFQNHDDRQWRRILWSMVSNATGISRWGKTSDLVPIHSSWDVIKNCQKSRFSRVKFSVSRLKLIEQTVIL
jgi:hypothetical protein